MGYKVAVVGATGNVGREMLSILAERAFPADEVVALASRRSQGTEVSFGDRTSRRRPSTPTTSPTWTCASCRRAARSRRNGRPRSRRRARRDR
jgi:aspartate-semialdehyde dehydrogenase